MNQREENELKKTGFTGFVPVSQLRMSSDNVPKENGIYVVLRRQTKEIPKFLETSPVEYHTKDRKTDREKKIIISYPIEDLKNQWIQGTSIMYIGKSTDINKRIRTFIKFGQGQDVSHRGGRSIWQLPEAENLVFAWRVLPPSVNAAEEERMMINNFKESHGGKLPFANRI